MDKFKHAMPQRKKKKLIIIKTWSKGRNLVVVGSYFHSLYSPYKPVFHNPCEARCMFKCILSEDKSILSSLHFLNVFLTKTLSKASKMKKKKTKNQDRFIMSFICYIC